MSTQVTYFPFTGGLDTVTSPILMKDGRMLSGENFEEVFGVQGYRRIKGYERFDGNVQPSQAQYYTLNFITGTAAISVGNTVVGATSSATGKVVQVTLTSGSWAGGNAAGYLIIYNFIGAFVNAENLQVSAATKAVCSGTAVVGTIGDTYFAAAKALVIADARAAILAVPGSGGILGHGLYKGVVFAARNATDGLTAAIYKSSSTGWTLVKAGLIPSGRWIMQVANFTGTATSLSLFGVDGKNNQFYYNDTTYQKIYGLWDSDASSVTSITIGTGAKTFVITETNMNYAASEAVTIWDSANAANRMIGTVTSWTSGTKTLVMNITETSGSGTKTAWDVGMTDFSDKSFLLREHKNHMFSSFPLGQLQTSDLGDPLVTSTTAVTFGMGDEITSMFWLKGDNLAIWCRNKIRILSGSDKATFVLDRYSAEGGGLFNTATEVAGGAFFIDDGGVKSLQATQVYGNYEAATLSSEVTAELQGIMPTLVGCHGNKKSQQYRMYSSTGKVLVGTIITPNPLITPKDMSFTVSKYPHSITCAITGQLVDGTEASFFGTSDGYVMREGVGTSFDGAAISSVMRLPFNNYKSPSNRKRFRKLMMELAAPETITVNFKQAFDYLDGNIPSSANQSTIVTGAGGAWNDATWNTFQWSQPMQTQSEVSIAGVGRNMSLLIWHESAVDDSFTLQGLTVHYSPLGLMR